VNTVINFGFHEMLESSLVVVQLAASEFESMEYVS
jgi:hypothetical protein